MESSSCYSKIKVANPGYKFKYQLMIFEDRVGIKYNSPIRVHDEFCNLYFKVENG